MPSPTSMRMVRTSTTSCTCLCDPQDGAPLRPPPWRLTDPRNPAPGPGIPQDPGMCLESLPMPGQWPLDFHSPDGTGFEVITPHPVSCVCLIFLVPLGACQATFTYLKCYQGHPNWKRFEARDREGLRGRGRFKTTDNPSWVLLFPSLAPFSIAEEHEVQGLLRVTCPLIEPWIRKEGQGGAASL